MPAGSRTAFVAGTGRAPKPHAATRHRERSGCSPGALLAAAEAVMLLNPHDLPWQPFVRRRAWPYGVQVVTAVYIQVTALAMLCLTGRTYWLACAGIGITASVWYLRAERQLFVALSRRWRREVCIAAHEWCVLLGISLAAASMLAALVNYVQAAAR